MRIRHALLQKAERVGKQRAGFALEGIGQCLDRDLGRNFTVMVAAHAVGDDHQQRIARVATGCPVLVVGPAALAAILINGKSHQFCFLNLLTTRPSQLGSAFGVGGVTVSTSAFCKAKTLCGR